MNGSIPASPIESWFRTQVGKEARRFVWLGVGLLIIGLAALVFPVVSTLAATLFVGWIFVFSGAVTLYGSFSIRGTGPFFGAMLLGLLSIAAGVYTLARPDIGAASLTLMLGGLFMLQGAYELVLAFELRSTKAWVWLAASALASIVLSLAILSGWPGTSLVTLGVLIGVNFVSSGLAFLLLGIGAKAETKA